VAYRYGLTLISAAGLVVPPDGFGSTQRIAPAARETTPNVLRDTPLGTELAGIGQRWLGVERAMGIEPTAQAWEAWVLPLYDARLG
jgi:hypothetical protein